MFHVKITGFMIINASETCPLEKDYAKTLLGLKSLL
jgi:hypothetical protein